MTRVLYALTIAVFMTTPLAASDLNFSTPRSITATGLTPGAPVIWFGATVESTGYELRARRLDGQTTADPSGTAVYEPELGVPTRSVWIAVDLITGRFAVGKPEGSPGTIRQVGPDDLQGSSKLRRRTLGSTSAEVLFIRPGKGAWALSLSDGGPADSDARADGEISINPTKLKGIRQSGPPPAEVTSGDVVVVIHPFNLEMFTAQVLR
jgi:hypothetical protein